MYNIKTFVEHGDVWMPDLLAYNHIERFDKDGPGGWAAYVNRTMYVRMYVCMYVCMCVCMYVRVCVYIYIYIYTHWIYVKDDDAIIFIVITMIVLIMLCSTVSNSINDMHYHAFD